MSRCRFSVANNGKNVIFHWEQFAVHVFLHLVKWVAVVFPSRTMEKMSSSIESNLPSKSSYISSNESLSFFRREQWKKCHLPLRAICRPSLRTSRQMSRCRFSVANNGKNVIFHWEQFAVQVFVHLVKWVAVVFPSRTMEKMSSSIESNLPSKSSYISSNESLSFFRREQWKKCHLPLRAICRPSLRTSRQMSRCRFSVANNGKNVIFHWEQFAVQVFVHLVKWVAVVFPSRTMEKMSSSIESNLPSKSSYISSNESLSFFRREQWKKCHLPLRAICRPSLRTSRQMSRCRFSVANNGKNVIFHWEQFAVQVFVHLVKWVAVVFPSRTMEKMSSSIGSNLPSKSSYISSNESLSFFRREQCKKCHLPLRAIRRPSLRTSRQMSRCRFSVANNGKNVIFHWEQFAVQVFVHRVKWVAVVFPSRTMEKCHLPLRAICRPSLRTSRQMSRCRFSVANNGKNVIFHWEQFAVQVFVHLVKWVAVVFPSRTMEKMSSSIESNLPSKSSYISSNESLSFFRREQWKKCHLPLRAICRPSLRTSRQMSRCRFSVANNGKNVIFHWEQFAVQVFVHRVKWVAVVFPSRTMEKCHLPLRAICRPSLRTSRQMSRCRFSVANNGKNVIFHWEQFAVQVFVHRVKWVAVVFPSRTMEKMSSSIESNLPSTCSYISSNESLSFFRREQWKKCHLPLRAIRRPSLRTSRQMSRCRFSVANNGKNVIFHWEQFAVQVFVHRVKWVAVVFPSRTMEKCHLPLRAICRPSLRTSRQMSRCRFSVANNGKNVIFHWEQFAVQVFVHLVKWVAVVFPSRTMEKMSSSIESNLPSKSSYISSNESLSFFRREQWKKCHLPLRAICRPSLRTSRQMSRCRFSVANNGKNVIFHWEQFAVQVFVHLVKWVAVVFPSRTMEKCHLPLRAICRPSLRTSRQMSRCRFSVANNGKNVIFHWEQFAVQVFVHLVKWVAVVFPSRTMEKMSSSIESNLPSKSSYISSNESLSFFRREQWKKCHLPLRAICRPSLRTSRQMSRCRFSVANNGKNVIFHWEQFAVQVFVHRVKWVAVVFPSRTMEKCHLPLRAICRPSLRTSRQMSRCRFSVANNGKNVIFHWEQFAVQVFVHRVKWVAVVFPSRTMEKMSSSIESNLPSTCSYISSNESLSFFRREQWKKCHLPLRAIRRPSLRTSRQMSRCRFSVANNGKNVIFHWEQFAVQVFVHRVKWVAVVFPSRTMEKCHLPLRAICRPSLRTSRQMSRCRFSVANNGKNVIFHWEQFAVQVFVHLVKWVAVVFPSRTMEKMSSSIESNLPSKSSYISSNESLSFFRREQWKKCHLPLRAICRPSLRTSRQMSRCRFSVANNGKNVIFHWEQFAVQVFVHLVKWVAVVFPSRTMEKMSSSIEGNLPSKSSYISSNESLSFFRREQWKNCHLPLRAICRPSLRTSRQMSRCRFSVANNGKNVIFHWEQFAVHVFVHLVKWVAVVFPSRTMEKMSSSIESNLPSKSSYISSNESLSFFRREQWKKCHLPLRAICRPSLRTSRQMSRCRFSVANNGKNVIFHWGQFAVQVFVHLVKWVAVVFPSRTMEKMSSSIEGNLRSKSSYISSNESLSFFRRKQWKKCHLPLRAICRPRLRTSRQMSRCRFSVANNGKNVIFHWEQFAVQVFVHLVKWVAVVFPSRTMEKMSSSIESNLPSKSSYISSNESLSFFRREQWKKCHLPLRAICRPSLRTSRQMSRCRFSVANNGKNVIFHWEQFAVHVFVHLVKWVAVVFPSRTMKKMSSSIESNLPSKSSYISSNESLSFFRREQWKKCHLPLRAICRPSLRTSRQMSRCRFSVANNGKNVIFHWEQFVVQVFVHLVKWVAVGKIFLAFWRTLIL